MNEFRRMILKVSDVAGVSATVPTTNDHTDGSWLNTDIYEGELFLNIIDNVLQTRTESGVILVNSVSSDAQRVVKTAKYDEAVIKGDPLRITGYNVGSGIVTVAKADASSDLLMASYGLASENYTIGATGTMIVSGDLTNIDTSAFVSGDKVYVASGGGLTNVKPIEPNLVQNVGFVSRSNVNTGAIQVVAIGRVNDVPNLEVGFTFIGTATNPIQYDLITALDSKVDGTGTTNYVSKWTGATTQGDSLIFDNGTNVGIGTTAPTQILDVRGKIAVVDGESSVFVGLNSGLADLGDTQNVGVGIGTLENNTSGYDNTAIGYRALRNNVSGNNLTAIGRGSLQNNTIGNNNTANGYNSGRFISDGTTVNSIISNSVYLGFNTKALANNQTNQIVIGYDATGIGSNSVVLGNDSIVTTALKGNVGIGTTSPNSPLEVNGTSGGNGIRVTRTNQSWQYIDINESDGSAHRIQAVGDKPLQISNSSTNNGIEFEVSGTEAMRITSGGNVGIGTTLPTEKLEVNGNIKADGSVQVGDNTDTAIASNVGAIRYRTDGQASYADMCMETSGGIYEWVNIVTNTF